MIKPSRQPILRLKKRYGMAFIGYIKKMLNQSGEDQPASSPAVQRRQHFRYEVNSPQLCVISQEHLGQRPIGNISHFGCFVISEDKSLPHGFSLPTKAQLTICGLMQPVEITKIEFRKGGFGLTFRHATIELLQSMSDVLLPIRWGHTAIHLGDEACGQPGGKRSKYRGEGPFDLIVETTPAEDVSFVMATFLLPSGEYASVVWDGSRIMTKKSLDQSGLSARMSQTLEPDSRLIAVCAVACLGMKHPLGARCAKLMVEAIGQ